MKILIIMRFFLIISLLLLFNLNSFSQKRKLDDDTKRTMSYVMIAGGVSLSIGSVTTPIEWSRDSNGLSYNKPLYENPAHFAGLLSGVGISVGGLFTMLSTQSRNKRRK